MTKIQLSEKYEYQNVAWIERSIHVIPNFKKGKDNIGNYKSYYVNHFIDGKAFNVMK
jgi:hypothetical protein